MDQPGSGEALRLHGMTARHDSEHRASRVVDWLEARDDVDPRRIGLEGVSLGGYFCPGAVAFEPRVIASRDDASLPTALGTASMLRETVYGVADAATLEAIADELGKHREVRRGSDGSVAVRDDMDLHDGAWTAREAPMGADTSQLFLFQHREKWAPGGPPPGAQRAAVDH